MFNPLFWNLLSLLSGVDVGFSPLCRYLKTIALFPKCLFLHTKLLKIFMSRMKMGWSVLTYPERTVPVSKIGYQDLGFIRKSRFFVTQCLLPPSFTIWPCIWSLSTLMSLAEVDQDELCVTSEKLQDCTLSSKYHLSPVSWGQSALNMGIQVQRAIGSYFPFNETARACKFRIWVG